MDIRERFIKNNIPYDELDKEIIELVDLLNFKHSIKTRYSCYGHLDRPWNYISIVFDDNVTDKQIETICKKIYLKNPKVDKYWYFKKWVRVLGYEVAANWCLYTCVHFTEECEKDGFKESVYESLLEVLR